MTRRRQAVEPSLFPFLAVLVCTMGSLILMLAMVTQRARAAVASQSTVLRETTEDIERVQREQEWLAKEYIEARQAQTEQLDRTRGELAHLEGQIDRLQQELEDLQRQVQVAQAEDDPAATEKIRASIDELEQRRAELAEQITAQEDAPGRPPRIVILPHRGPSGTARRPIYVECLEDRLVVQPEGVVIPIQLLRGPLGPGNPLAVALRTARAHWAQKDLQAQDPPYPLLIVRPNGVNAYAAARAAMEGWDDQFGYELVPAQVELEFGQEDRVLHENLNRAVAAALERQAAMIASMPAAFSGEPSEQLISGPGGNGTPPPARRTARSAAESTAHSNGGDQAIDLTVDGSATAQGSGADVSSWRSSVQSALRGSSASGSGGTFFSGTDSRTQLTDSRFASSAATAPAANPGSASGTSTGTTTLGAFGSGFQTPTADRNAGTSSSTGEGSGAGLAASPNDSITPGMLAEPGADPSSFGGPASTIAALDASGTSQGPLGQPLDSAGLQAEPGTPGSSDVADGDTSELAPQGGSQGNATVNGSAASTAMQPRPQSMTGADTRQMMNSSNSSMAQSMSAPQTDGMPPTDAELDAQAKAAQQQRPRRSSLNQQDTVAVRRALNVGDLGTEAPSGPSAVRRIAITVNSDALTIAPATTRHDPVTVPIADGQVGPAAVKLAEQIRQRIASWGPPVSGGSWQVVLSADVGPDGDGVFADLEQLLTGSGVKLERKERP